MTHIAFSISTVLLWLGINYVWSLIPRGGKPDDGTDFDMTTEMSRSGGYSLQLVATGICSAVIAFIAFGLI